MRISDCNSDVCSSDLLPIAEGQRTCATMAALVEDARWRTSARGRRYLMATLSDATGQFIATCFDDAVAADLEAAAKTGGCGLLTVELDRRAGEETPRARKSVGEGKSLSGRVTSGGRSNNKKKTNKN